MKKQIMSLLDKKTNRLEYLSDYRRYKNLNELYGGKGFEIEVSPKTLKTLKKRQGKKIVFSLEHDFGIKENTKEAYWLRVDGEYPKKKTDFTYLVTGYINPFQQSGMDDWGVSLALTHIDVATTWGQLEAITDMIAEWLDKKYGDDCGFKRRFIIENMKLDFIKNKKIK